MKITAMNSGIKIISFACVIMLFSSSGFGQFRREDDRENFFRFGARGGVNVNKVAGKSYTEAFRYNFQLGGFLQFNFSRRFGLQPEVNLVQALSEMANDPNTVAEDLFLGGSQHKAKFSNVEVPVLLNVNIGGSKRVKLQFGPTYDGGLKQTLDSLKGGNNFTRQGTISGIAGLWLQLPFINLSARYKVSLSKTEDHAGVRSRQQAIQISAGISF